MRVRKKISRLGAPTWAFVWIAVCLAHPAPAQDPAPDTGQNPLRIVLGREHAGPYTGGRTVNVVVRIGASSWDGLTAMGLYEKIPDGWTLEDVRLLGGVPPSVSPEAGTGGVLQFIWILPPRAPVALGYTLRVPARDSGARPFSGQVEYRLGGGKLTSNVALTQLDGVADELPVVTLQGEAEMSVAQFATFVDPGATASDKEDGDISNRIQVAGQVDTREPGDYSLTYGVMDSARNRAEPVTRTVTVTRSANTPAGGSGGAGPGAPTGAGRPPRPAPVRANPLAPRPAPAGPPPPGALDLPDVVTPGLDNGRPPFSVPKTGGSGDVGLPEGVAPDGPQGKGVLQSGDAGVAGKVSAAPVTGPGPHEAVRDGGLAPYQRGSASGRAIAIGLTVLTLILVSAGWWTAAGSGRRRSP